MDKDKVKKYRDKLEASIEEYMEMPLSQRSAEAVESMCECLEHINSLLGSNDHDQAQEGFTNADYEKWMDALINADGTEGAHWTIIDTNSVGKPSEIDEIVWNATMNMLYSDYYEVFKQYGVGTAQFYADVAKAFLMDEDAPVDKLARYYHAIVE